MSDILFPEVLALKDPSLFVFFFFFMVAIRKLIALEKLHPAF